LKKLRQKKFNDGWLIGIEGIDAAGKRTQSLLLSSWLRDRQLNCEVMSFPDYSTRIGKEIRAFLVGRRNYPNALKHILFAGNRWEKLNEIENLLKNNEILIVNRYTESNLAYGVANGLELNWLANLEKGLPSTDLVILLDAPSSVVRSRRLRSQDTYEADRRLQEDARRTYRRLARKLGWKVVDAGDDVNEVHLQIRTIVANRLSLGTKGGNRT
jgi:dTMP kinase